MFINLKRMAVIMTAICIGGLLVLGMTGCDAGGKYRVEYGDKAIFQNAKDAYTPGEKVELTYTLIATDTDYHFYLDGEELDHEYVDSRGLVVSFTMPAHDVKLTVERRSGMAYTVPVPSADEGTMLVDCYSATVASADEDDYTEYVLYSYTEEEARLSVFRKSGSGDETEERYIVPFAAVRECYAVIDRCDFAGWESLSGVSGLDGGRKVLKYYTTDGGYVRVSTDKMPAGGDREIDEVGDTIASYLRDEYRQ